MNETATTATTATTEAVTTVVNDPNLFAGLLSGSGVIILVIAVAVLSYIIYKMAKNKRANGPKVYTDAAQSNRASSVDTNRMP